MSSQGGARREALEGYVVDQACLPKYPQKDLLLGPAATTQVVEALRATNRERGVRLRATREMREEEMRATRVNEV